MSAADAVAERLMKALAARRTAEGLEVAAAEAFARAIGSSDVVGRAA